MTLVTVKIVTELGAEYAFPDVLRETVDSLLSSDTLHGFSQISFVNQSAACLVVPRRIIKTISVDGEIRWRSPA
jgi:hypothetical protein